MFTASAFASSVTDTTELEPMPLPGVETSMCWYEEELDELTAAACAVCDDAEDLANQDAQQAADRARDKQERRQRNTEQCGKKWHIVIDPHTGIARPHTWFCKNYTECAVCAHRRKSQLIGPVYSVLLAEHELVYEILPLNEATTLCRSIAKEDYKRIPISDTEVALFYEPQTLPGRGTRIPSKAELLTAIDWDEISGTKFKHNVSGNLAYSTTLPTPSTTEEPVVVELTNWQITTHTPEAVIAAHGEGYDYPAILYDIYVATTIATAHLKPQTPEEVNEALRVRAQAYQTAAQERGLTCTIVPITKSTKLYLSRIAWNTDKDLAYRDYFQSAYTFQADQHATWHLKHPKKTP